MSFFRQSGWLMVANVISGMMMWAVHFLVKKIPAGEYSAFGTLIAVAMIIPTLPLQMVMAQQAAHALATGRERQFAGVVRLVLGLTLALWAVAAALMLLFQGSVIARWQLPSPLAYWITLPVLLFALCLPILWGVLQGIQNFLWLGWSMMFNGIGRIVISAAAVFVFGAAAGGMMIGVLVGMLAATLLALWQIRALLALPSEPFDTRKLLAQVGPLVLGFAAFQFLFTADTLFAKSYFDEVTMAYYVGAGTLSRALMWLVAPLATVMFPRIVQSAARSEKSDLANLVLLGTGVLAICGAGALALMGPWVVRFVYTPEFVKAANQLLPWYAFAMVPLAMANVLLNNLLARGAFKVVPALCVLAGIYGFALTRFHGSLVMVIQTMGVCNIALFAISAWYTWVQPPAAPAAAE